MNRLVLFLLLIVPAISFAIDNGKAGPAFTLENYDDAKVKLTDPAAEYYVLEWTNPKCPFVRRHATAGTMKGLAEKYKDKKVKWIAINSTHFHGKSDNEAYAKKYGLDTPVLDDHLGDVGQLYGASTTPHMFILDKNMKIVYQGAIDNDPFGDEEERVNYVDQALAALTAGKSPETASSKPYGCSVKYKG